MSSFVRENSRGEVLIKEEQRSSMHGTAMRNDCAIICIECANDCPVSYNRCSVCTLCIRFMRDFQRLVFYLNRLIRSLEENEPIGSRSWGSWITRSRGASVEQVQWEDRGRPQDCTFRAAARPMRVFFPYSLEFINGGLLGIKEITAGSANKEFSLGFRFLLGIPLPILKSILTVRRTALL